jgi:exosortase K
MRLWRSKTRAGRATPSFVTAAGRVADTVDEAKPFISQNGMFLFLTLVLAVSLKHHYSEAGSEDLAWILRPTAWLVEHIGKIRFEEEAHTGFVNYSRRIVIASACAGVNFLIIALCMAAFSGLHHLQRRRHLFRLAHAAKNAPP